MRRSCRLYKDENIPVDVMEALKKSLAWSPTGCNNHKLYFYIVENKEAMSFFREKTFSMLKFLIKSGILGLFFPRFKRFFAAVMAGKDVVYRNAPHMIIAATPKKAPCKEAVPLLEGLLTTAELTGKVECSFAEIIKENSENPCDNIQRTSQLKEIYLLKALAACDPENELALSRLKQYSESPQYLYASFCGA
jgi:hypothetical protein